MLKNFDSEQLRQDIRKIVEDNFYVKSNFLRKCHMKKLHEIIYKNKWFFIFFLGLVGVSIFQARHDELTLVATTGIHHLGKGYSIPAFYLNGNFRGNIPREGDGGVVCCVSIPVVWSSDLKIEVRWSIADWKSENIDETARGEYRSIRLFKSCRVAVKVSKYDQPGRLYVHFFSEGKVQIISTDDSATSVTHASAATPEGVRRPVLGVCHGP